MYHRFSSETCGLERQCEHICRNYQPISLDTFVDCLQSDRSVPSNALVVTVDDGYRDFLLHAHPVFHRFGIPATVYLVTKFVSGDLWLWWNQLEYAFQQTKSKTISINLGGQGAQEFSLASDSERRLAYRSVAQALTRVEDSERLRWLTTIPQLLGVEIPSVAPKNWAPLNWDEVRELSNKGVVFGAHTQTHPILSRLASREQQREEIEGSKLRLEKELGRPVRHFCYPNGSRTDFNEHTVDLVRDLGFQSAATTERGLNFPGSELFELRRIGVEPNLPEIYFAELLAGARAE
jgi:peptidoglycan/xylan/chitin deacetylase (PgdA/CDA1 family)